jgi:hypothetical protein
MEYFFIALAYGTPFFYAIGAALLVVVFAGVTLSRPSVLLYPFFILLFFVTDISYGRVDAVAPSIFSRGVGFLLFPLYLWLVLASLIWANFSTAFYFKPLAALPRLDINRWFMAWLLLFGAHVLVAAAAGQDLLLAIGPNGFSNLVWMWVFFLAIIATFRNESAVLWLSRAIMFAGLGRATFGLVRWVAFGGDPANAYANRHGLQIKLTFFDIYDSLICMLTICIAAMWLFRGPRAGKRTSVEALLLWLCMGIPALCIILSFRRAAAIGMVIAGIFLLFQLPRHARWQLAVAAAPVAIGGAGYAIWKRLSQTRGAGGLDRFLFDITPSNFGPESVRLLELKLAWASFLENPLVGVGAWGSYGGSALISWQEDAAGAFLHSGVLHVGLKSGLLGLILMCGLVWSYARFWREIRHQLSDAVAPLAVAGVAGILFALPDFLIGTPVTKIRATQLLAFCLALPYVAAIASGVFAVGGHRPVFSGGSGLGARRPHISVPQ